MKGGERGRKEDRKTERQIGEKEIGKLSNLCSSRQQQR
jgi:hypothetical protein